MMYVQHNAKVQHVYVRTLNATSICDALCMQRVSKHANSNHDLSLTPLVVTAH